MLGIFPKKYHISILLCHSESKKQLTYHKKYYDLHKEQRKDKT